MSVSNYVLNQRISNLQYEIDHLPVGSLNLDDVLTNGNDANGQDILNVDNLQCNTINGAPIGGAQNLDQVLTVGNTATNKNIVLANATGNTTFNPAYIQHTNTTGNDLSISSNQNITVSADNIDIGTNRLIFPSLAVGNYMDYNAGGLKLSNNTGGTLTPVLNLTQTALGGGVLVQEVYNQKTAVNGESFRQSFYAKTSTGAKNEYARIHVNTPVVTTGTTRGKIDFDVNVNTGVTNYLSINGNTQQVDIFNSNLHLNSNNIVGASTIQTPTGNYYLKGINEYYNANTTSPTAVEDKLRWVGVNTGKPNTWVNSGVNDFSSAGGGVENVTASQYGYNGYWWVGTESGKVYYSNDTGSSWTLQGNYGGRINCFQSYYSGSYMAVGGQFNNGTGSSFNYLFGIDNGNNSFDMTGGSSGLNNEVKCFCDNTSYNCLYIGGLFDAFYGASNQSLKFITFAYSASTWYFFNNYSGGSGFYGGNVYSISIDFGSSFIVVGGSYTDVSPSGSGIGQSYIFTWNTSDGYTINSYFSLGLALNNQVNSVMGYGSGCLVGGQFNNTQGYGSCNSNYGIYIVWTGSSWDIQTYPYFQPNNTVKNIFWSPSTGDYFTSIEDGAVELLYKNNIQTPTIPIGAVWNCVIYNGSTVCYATNGQTSAGFIFYNLDQSVGITITASGLQTFNTNGGQNFTSINAFSIGSAFEAVYRLATDSWWVISYQSCNFS